MYSNCDDTCDVTFIDNSVSKVLLLHLLQHVVTVIMHVDATFINDRTSKSHNYFCRLLACLPALNTMDIHIVYSGTSVSSYVLVTTCIYCH